MFKVRLQFSKTGRAKFLSHLDVMRVMQRALTRANVPVEYSNGFNPHMKLSIAFPLPLGVESDCELLDVQLEYPCSGLVEKLNASLPEGFAVTGTLPLTDINSITHIAYRIVFTELDGSIFDGRPLVIQKKSKSGINPLDIAPHILKPEAEDNVLTAALSAVNPTVSPAHVLDAVRLFAPQTEIISSRRTGLVYKDK